MEIDMEKRRAVAEFTRKAYKELRWAANNMAAIYELIRPADMPPIEDPNQLKLFEDEQG
jgi:hypothetical protein